MVVDNKEIAQYVTRLQKGDGAAFGELYEATNQSGYYTALKILKDEHEAQDVLQDSYIQVLEKLDTLQNPESFVGWFHQIVANRAKNVLRKKKPSFFSEDEETYTQSIPDEDEDSMPERNLDQAELRRQIIQIINGMSDEKRACALLYYYNEMSVGEISRTMGVNENTIKARLYQVRKDIKKAIEKLAEKGVITQLIVGFMTIGAVIGAVSGAMVIVKNMLPKDENTNTSETVIQTEIFSADRTEPWFLLEPEVVITVPSATETTTQTTTTQATKTPAPATTTTTPATKTPATTRVQHEDTTLFTTPATASTTKATTSATHTTTTTKATTETTTQASTTTPATTAGQPVTYIPHTTTTRPTTTYPPTTIPASGSTTVPVKKATCLITYTIQNTSQRDTITRQVPVGIEITWSYIEFEVRKHLSDSLISDITPINGSEVSSAQERTYEFEVLVSLS